MYKSERGRSLSADRHERRFHSGVRGAVKWLLWGALFGASAGAWAAHDLVLQHSGPLSAPVTGTATYRVTLDNSHVTHTDAATGVSLVYTYDATLASFSSALFTNGSGSCSDAAGTVTCSVNDIPHGTTDLTVDFAFYIHGSSLSDASFGSGTTVFNPTATVTSTGDQVGGNETESWSTTILAGTDLGVTLTSNPASGSSVASGTLWSHEVVVTNHGPLSATGAKATLQLAAGAQWVTSTLPSGCSIVASNVECVISGTFAKDATATFSGIQSRVIAAAGSSLSLTTVVSSNRTDQNATNNSANSSANVTPGTDLILDLSATGGTILAGDPSTVTVTPTYSGDVPGTPTFTVTIPAGLTVDTGSLNTDPRWGSCLFSGAPIDTLACSGWNATGAQAGAQQSMGPVSFNVSGPAGSYTVNGAAISTSPEADSSNNNDSVVIGFQTPTINISIEKSGPPVTERKLTSGAAVSYTVTLRNPSSSNVHYWGPLSFTEIAPAGLTINSITPPSGDWACTTSGCSRTYTEAAPFPRNSTQVFTVNATVNSDTGTSLVNQVCRAAFTHPLVGTENAQTCANAPAITGHPVAEGTDLSVDKSVTTAAGDIKAGDWLAYEVEMRNTGLIPAVNAVMTDTLSALVPSTDGGSFQITAIPAGWTCSNGGTSLTEGAYLNTGSVSLSCQTASFAVCTVGSCPTVAFRIRPQGNATSGTNQSRTNTAYISSETPEPNFANNTDSVTSAIQPKTDFTIAKSVTSWDNKTGTELQYTITVTNANQASGASNVVVTDVLPENVTYLGISGSTLPSCSGVTVGATTTAGAKTLTCTWSSFPRTGVRNFIVRIRPNNEQQGQTFFNDVYVNVEPGTQTAKAGTTEESDYTNNHAQASATADESDIDLQVSKVDRTDPVMVGAEVEYEIRIVNNGPSVATHASIYDYLPVNGFVWVGEVRYWNVNPDSTLTEITGGDLTAAGISCSKTPAVDAAATGGEDKAQPSKLNWLWPMNATNLDPADPAYNPAYVNGKWDTRISTNADIICNMGLLETGQARALTYKLKAVERGVYLNHAIVRSQEHIDRVAQNFADANWNNDVAQHRTTVRSVPDVALEKTVSQSPVSLMEPFSYSITVTNNHASEQAYFPEVRDTLPANMVLTGAPTLASGSLSGGSFSCVRPGTSDASAAGDNAFICSLGNGVPSGGSQVVIQVPVRVVGGTVATLTNTAALHLDTDLVFDAEPAPVLTDDEDVQVVVSSIAGHVYHDVNNNGVRDGGEAAINGVTITLTGTDLYGNVVSATTAVTSGAGAYKFDNLAPGTYTVTETHPSNWVDGKDTVGLFGVSPGSGVAGNDVISNIVLPADTHGIEYNFGEFKELLGGATAASISGYVYHDANNNGVKEGSEAAIPGVTINLSGANGDVRSTTTDASGFYKFEGLEPGVVYTVTEVQPSGWNDGQETAGTVFNNTTTANDTFVVTPTSGGNGENWNFGERQVPPPDPQPTTASVSGKVYHDRNNNGLPESGEEGIAGVSVVLWNNAGEQVASTTTDANGAYRFTGLQPGSYRITEVQPQGWLDGKERVGSHGGSTPENDEFIGIVLNAGNVGINYDFGELKPASIAGVVFIDLNQNATLDADEAVRIPGVAVMLAGTDDLGQAVERTLTTNEHGAYRFDNLRPGNYTVTETSPTWLTETGAQPGVPVRGSASSNADTQQVSAIALASGENLVDYNFGHLGARVEGTVYHDKDKGGQWQPGQDEPLVGVTVRITDASGRVHEVTTDENGFFSQIVPPGATVVEVLESTLTGLDQPGLTVDTHNEGSNPTTVDVPLGGVGVDNTGYVGETAQAELRVVKTVYEGHNAGAGCPGVKELVVIDKSREPKPMTWCFALTNNGPTALANPQFDDAPLFTLKPGTAQGPLTLRAGSVLPLQSGETVWYYVEEMRDSSLINEVSVSMTPVDENGDPLDLPPVTGEDGAVTVFGYLYDPPFGVKTGEQIGGSNVVRWTMVWVNDNPVRAENATVSDQVPVGMTYQGGLNCVPAGTTTVSQCAFEPPSVAFPRGRVVVTADFGPDYEKTVDTAEHALRIAFDVTVDAPEEGGAYHNQGVVEWDPDGPGGEDPLEGVTDDPFNPDSSEENPAPTPVVIDPVTCVPGEGECPPVDPVDPPGDGDDHECKEGNVQAGNCPPTDVTPIPVNSPLGLLLMVLMLIGMTMYQRHRTVMR